MSANRKKEENSLKRQNELEQETKEKKTFEQDIFKIEYVNTSKIYYQESAHSMDVKVNNYLCYQNDNNLYKITEIIYEDKLIRIQDKFEVNVDPNKLKINTNASSSLVKEKHTGKNIEKVRIFAKDVNVGGKKEKKDKKNIVKNIVKIFLSWLQKKQVEKQGKNIKESLNQLKELMAGENFNNRLIKKIVNSAEASKTFLEFLTEDADDEIKYSRIQDKDSHYEAIELYVNLLRQKGSGEMGSHSEQNHENSISLSPEEVSSQPKGKNSSIIQINNQKIRNGAVKPKILPLQRSKKQEEP